MSPLCDLPGEMPDDCRQDDLDDESIEWILEGRPAADPGLAPLAEFALRVRAAADRPAPRPNAELAPVLMSGFSTEKGDPLVTAVSNVHGPAEPSAYSAAGRRRPNTMDRLPKWRKRHSMLPTGLLTGLPAKIVAGVVAGLGSVTAVGAVGALPGPAQHAVASVVEAVSPFHLPDGGGEAAIGVGAGANPAGPGAGVDVNAGAGGTDLGVTAGASTGVQASVGTGTNGAGADATAGATTGGLPNLPNLPGLFPGLFPGLSNLPNLSTLPGVQIPSCVKDIVDLNTGQPKVPLSQIAPQVISCVRTLMATSGVQLPAGLDQCVSSILSLVGNITPGSVPDLSSFDFSKCVPIDVTQCMSSVMGMVQNLMPGFGIGGTAGTGGTSASGSASLPGLSGFDLSGCLPFNLDACLSSILGMAGNLPGLNLGGVPGLGGGTVPSVGSLDLSSCVPFGAMANIPSLSQFRGLMPR